jgi:hypothetical protein
MGLKACLQVSIESIPYSFCCYILCVKAKTVPGLSRVGRQAGGWIFEQVVEMSYARNKFLRRPF